MAYPPAVGDRNCNATANSPGRALTLDRVSLGRQRDGVPARSR
jgi:hypothetical protein